MTEWTPDRPVDAALARRLIAKQFPSIDIRDLSLVGAGWDNVVYRADGLFFRFPVREVAVPGVRKEIACLPILACHVTPVAAPAHVGEPAPEYPWPFFGYIPLPGREACEADMDDEARRRLARPLARFLRRLHAPEVAAAFDSRLPGDVWGRMDMAKRVPRAEALYERCRMKLGTLPVAADAVASILDAARNRGRLPETAVVHGDLHFRHVLVNDAAAFAGAIDWGDMHRGNPAVDLMIAWGLLPPEARSEFWDEYGSITEDQRRQSRLLALYLALTLLEYAAAENLLAVRREALKSLELVGRE